ncbi:MAG: DMT family transporter [Sphaerobacter sp.]|nr:DMT family transporter [Sphaerobacter sp.]
MRASHLTNLLLLSAIWGSSYVLIKVVVAGVNPLTLVAGRLALGAAFLVIAARLSGLRLQRRPAELGHLVVMAVTGNILPFVLIAWAEERVTSSLAAVLNATTPFFTLLLATLAFRTERITAAKLVGIVVGFTGVALLTGIDPATLGTASGQGVLALLASSLCYGVAFAYARRYVRGAPIAIAATQLTIAAVLLAPIALLFGDVGATDLTLTRAVSWLALGLLPTGAAYILYYRLIAEVGATRASYTTYIIPVVGVAWGWLLLDETLGWQGWLGVAVIFLGLAIASSRPRTAPRPATTPRPTETGE